MGRTLAELDIRWIPAHSPQATGRIERLWGTLQDRLVSELRRARAVSRDKANAHVCCFTYARTVANDNTVRLEEHLIQILPGPGRRSYAKARVEVHEHLALTPALDAGAGPSLASIRAQGTAKESTQRGRSVIFVEQIR